MCRRKRIVVPGEPHHVTQRGARKQQTFFEIVDREVYLGLLRSQSKKYGVDIISYCLMSNHTHLLVVPKNEDSLRWTLQITHKRYAEYINSRYNWSGHLWQQRFYSCPVDEYYFLVTLRYIERNPVVAKMVMDAISYEWSSAAAHCGLRDDPLISLHNPWVQRIRQIGNLQQWFQKPGDSSDILKLCQSTKSELPCGSDEFLDGIEARLGVSARAPKMGRPKKSR